MRIISFLVYLFLAIGFITDIAFISSRYAWRFTMAAFLVTVAFTLVRVKKNPRRGPLSTTSKVVVITLLIIMVICFLTPRILNIKQGIPMRETGLVLEKAPFAVKYGKDIKDVNAETFFINSFFMTIMFNGIMSASCFLAWHEAKIESERKKKRDAKYLSRKMKKN